jgi:hypothetical protein
MRQHLHALVLCVAAVAATACDESLSKVAGPTPNLEPSFSTIQRDIFEAPDSSGRPNCNKCHNAAGRLFTAGLSLDHDVAYSSLVNVASTRKAGATRVIPGDPENSYLVHKIEGRPGIVGQRMPFSGPFSPMDRS